MIVAIDAIWYHDAIFNGFMIASSGTTLALAHSASP